MSDTNLAFGAEYLETPAGAAESTVGAGPAKIIITAYRVYQAVQFISDWIL